MSEKGFRITTWPRGGGLELTDNDFSGRSFVMGLRLTSQTRIESSVVRTYHLCHGDRVDAATVCKPVPVTGLEIGQSCNGAELVTDAFVQSALRKWGVLNGVRSRATRAVLEPHAIDPYMDDRAHLWRRLDPQDRQGGRAFPWAGFVAPHLAWAVGRIDCCLRSGAIALISGLTLLA
jgi:hypothetical protein